MNDTLSDKIGTLIDDNDPSGGGYLLIDEIIELIINKTHVIEKARGQNYYFGYSGDDEFLSGFDIGFKQAFEFLRHNLKQDLINNKSDYFK